MGSYPSTSDYRMVRSQAPYRSTRPGLVALLAVLTVCGDDVPLGGDRPVAELAPAPVSPSGPPAPNTASPDGARLWSWYWYDPISSLAVAGTALAVVGGAAARTVEVEDCERAESRVRRWRIRASGSGLALPEGERVRLGARLEEGDLQRPVADRVVLAHELVQAAVAESAVADFVDVDAV